MKEAMRLADPKQMLTMADLDAVLTQSRQRPVLVFKHSTTCPISAGAYRQWQSFLAAPEAEQVDHAWVRVREERPVSLALADRVGVVHQSPQALLIKNGKAVWHDSHHAITSQSLKQAVSR